MKISPVISPYVRSGLLHRPTLSYFPVHVAAQFGGDGAQLRLKAVARAAAWQPKDEFDSLFFHRPVLGDDAAAMRPQYLAIGSGAVQGAPLWQAFDPDAERGPGIEEIN